MSVVSGTESQWLTQESGKGGQAQGGSTWPGEHTAEGGGMLKYFFRMHCWQPLPVENHLLHNEVAQVGIERDINAEALWPLRCRF